MPVKGHEFACALRAAMIAKGLSNSELAKKVWGTTTDKRGYTVAKGRDRIGHYLAGTSIPEPENLRKIADALGVPYDELAATIPATMPRAREAMPPADSARVVVQITAPGFATSIDTVKSLKLAQSIARLAMTDE